MEDDDAPTLIAGAVFALLALGAPGLIAMVALLVAYVIARR